MTIVDAIDCLSDIANVDLGEDSLRLDAQGIKEDLRTFNRLPEFKQEQTIDIVRETFAIVYRYLQHLYRQDKNSLQGRPLKGVRAIMILAEKAIHKIETTDNKDFVSLFRKAFAGKRPNEIAHYKRLRQFYLNKFVKKFYRPSSISADLPEILEDDQQWTQDLQYLGIADLKVIRADLDYELFYLSKEDGTPFFRRNILRHMRLVSDFDQTLLREEEECTDPFLNMHHLCDHETHLFAKSIKERTKEELNQFCLGAMKHKELPIVREVNRLIMSLMLASNPSHLSQKASGKNCFDYFKDFHRTLRDILEQAPYQRLLKQPLETLDQLSSDLVRLLQALSYAFITQRGAKKGWSEFIFQLIEHSSSQNIEEFFPEFLPPSSLCRRILEAYELIAHALKKHPQGPFMKTVDAMCSSQKTYGFDPFSQDNYPEWAYTLLHHDQHIHCLRLPCPTLHEPIHQAQTNPEFIHYLHYLGRQNTPSKHLMIHLQDRQSWKSSARTKALEECYKRVENHQHFVLVNFSVLNHMFYQVSSHFPSDDYCEFIKKLKKSVEVGEESAFFFPHTLYQEKILPYLDPLFVSIHSYFFHNKPQLTRQERLDFIIIVYLFLSLKMIDLVQPDHLSFTCKDGVDLGPAMSSTFYLFIKLLEGRVLLSRKDQQTFTSLFSVPAFKIRERMILQNPFTRMISALLCIVHSMERQEQNPATFFAPLYGEGFLRGWHLSEEDN